MSDFMAKMHHGWGSDPDLAAGAYSWPPAGFKEAYFSANQFTVDSRRVVLVPAC